MAWPRRTISGITCASVSIAVLMAAGPASARFEVDTTTIPIDGTHGYHLQFEGTNLLFKRSGAKSVSVEVKKHHASASYAVQGTATNKVLQGDFGPFGKVDVKFHPRKTTHPNPPPGCTGTVKKISGVWKGVLKFKGENGYTRVSATSAKGYRSITDLNCTGGGGGTPGTSVILHAVKSAPPYPSFTAHARKKAGAKPDFFASASANEGDVSIYRSAEVKGDPSQFTYSPTYDHGSVDPPAPFRGTATFDSPNTWAGDLKVKLPGAGKVPLTGTGFNATLGEAVTSKLFGPAAAGG